MRALGALVLALSVQACGVPVSVVKAERTRHFPQTWDEEASAAAQRPTHRSGARRAQARRRGCAALPPGGVRAGRAPSARERARARARPAPPLG